MEYFWHYSSPVGTLTMYGDESSLCGLIFDNQKYNFAGNREERKTEIFKQTEKWLNIYFSGKEPDFTPALSFGNASDFRRKVWGILLEIPYGKTISYGDIAQRIEFERFKRVSAQAVGGAVGHNPISIIVPCHRVLGASGKLTGYAGGLDKKRTLLTLEKALFKE